MIFKLGIEKAIFDPSSTTRGLFLLACLIAGIIGGILSLLWHAGAALLSASLGGLSLGLFIQALHRDGLIHPLALRWVLYLGCIALFFCLAVWKRIQPVVLIAASAISGSTILVLGVDCESKMDSRQTPTSPSPSSLSDVHLASRLHHVRAQRVLRSQSAW